jgi:hypothetical protein
MATAEEWVQEGRPSHAAMLRLRELFAATEVRARKI